MFESGAAVLARLFAMQQTDRRTEEERHKTKGVRKMGKASELYEILSERPLTPSEIEARRSAAEDGGAVRATPDGRLLKIDRPTEKPREVYRAPRATWD